MNILYIASEAVPFLKTGGLGDVAYALPKALGKVGIDCRVLMPKAFELSPELKAQEQLLYEGQVQVGWRNQYFGISELKHQGVHYYFIDNEDYFKRSQIYGYDDDGERFSFFSRAAIEAILRIDFKPDVIHVNDWHTAAIPMLIKYHYADSPKLSGAKLVLSIHNLKYQGIFEPYFLGEFLNLPMTPFWDGSVEFDGKVNLLKSGIVYADQVLTVSRTYSDEILYPFYGEGLDEVLRNYSGKLRGITNGIDYDLYNPMKDPYIHQPYDSRTLESKIENKLAFQKEIGLKVSKDMLMIGIISRLVDMKGLDLIEHVIHEIFELNIQMVVLGKGDTHFENMFKYYAQRFPDRMRVFVEFNTPLAQRIYAGSDLFLMPSKIEPCGLGQIIALRYGTLPLVRETGGLRDTVIPYNEYTGDGNGFGFEHYNAHEMLFTLQKASELYQDKEKWHALMRHAMASDNSWEKSSKEYIDVYRTLIKK